MAGPTQPFPLPQKLPTALARLHRYWIDLRRGDNDIPFSDDVNPSALADLSNNLMLMDVFEYPQRFRFSLIGQEISAKLNPNIISKFADEFEPRRPLDFFLAQASVTVEARAPTFYHCEPFNEKDHRSAAYSRLLLPMWGNGQIDMLVGAIV
jgi:hypothetical protein